MTGCRFEVDIKNFTRIRTLRGGIIHLAQSHNVASSCEHNSDIGFYKTRTNFLVRQANITSQNSGVPGGGFNPPPTEIPKF
jgi:hypothetical protein